MPRLPETIIGETCEGQDVTWAEIEAAAEDVREWLDLKMTSGSYSTGLVYQLAAATAGFHRCLAIAASWSTYTPCLTK